MIDYNNKNARPTKQRLNQYIHSRLESLQDQFRCQNQMDVLDILISFYELDDITPLITLIETKRRSGTLSTKQLNQLLILKDYLNVIYKADTFL